jgi:hypothetical protein
MLGLTNMVVKYAVGKWGVGVVFWRRGIDVSLRNMSKYHINMDIKKDNGYEWRFTGVFEEAHSDQKHKTGQDLRDMMVRPTKPWLCAGDFNEILFTPEEGSRQKCQAKASFVSIGLIPTGIDKCNTKIMIATIRDPNLFRVEN